MTPKNPTEWKSAIDDLEQKLSAAKLALSHGIVRHEAIALDVALGDKNALPIFKKLSSENEILTASIASLEMALTAARRELKTATEAAAVVVDIERAGRIRAAMDERKSFLDDFDKAAENFATWCVKEIQNQSECAEKTGVAFMRHVAPSASIALNHHLLKNGLRHTAMRMSFCADDSSRVAAEKSVVDGWYGQYFFDECNQLVATLEG